MKSGNNIFNVINFEPMEVHLQNPEREDLSISFELNPFIAEWASAQQRFITTIAREFSELLSVRPQNFSANLSNELGESHCKYRIFGGASTIVLTPNTMQLNFVSLNENDSEIVIEIIRRSLDVLLKDIGGYTKDRFHLTSNQHVRAVNSESADAYLDQFALKQSTYVVKTDTTVEYRPAVKIILSDKGNNWILHRSVEKSELLDNGLFVTTHIFISSPDVAAFEDQRQLVERINNLADQSVGLKYPGGNNGDTTS